MCPDHLVFSSPVTCLPGIPSPLGPQRTSFSTNEDCVGAQGDAGQRQLFFLAFDFEGENGVEVAFHF